VKKLLLLLLIAVVGAGIAFGANAVFFSTASDERPPIEPRGLVGDASEAALSEPSASPAKDKDRKKAISEEGTTTTQISTSGASEPAPVPAPADDGSPRQPRTPSGSRHPPQPTAMVIQGIWDEQDSPEDPCDLEESERDQRRCENEADREEDEAEQDAEEDSDDD
jgi:hypothetical protein